MEFSPKTDHTMPHGKPDIQIFPNVQDLLRSVAGAIVEDANRVVSAQGVFTLVLSGGSTPKDLYSLLSSPPYRDRIVWEKVQVFWGDERHVPPDHQESNYRMANETLLSRVPIPRHNIFRIPGELPNANEAALEYESVLRKQVKHSGSPYPCFDMVLLGMGPDGHTASLFPGTDAVHERTRLVVAPWIEKFQLFRITLSPPVINQAARILFLVTGSNKADTVHAVLEGPLHPDQFPSQIICPVHGHLTWYFDQNAAVKLSPQ